MNTFHPGAAVFPGQGCKEGNPGPKRDFGLYLLWRASTQMNLSTRLALGSVRCAKLPKLRIFTISTNKDKEMTTQTLNFSRIFTGLSIKRIQLVISKLKIKRPVYKEQFSYVFDQFIVHSGHQTRCCCFKNCATDSILDLTLT